MRNVTLDEWVKYRDLLAQLNQKAADDFRDYFFGVGSKGLTNVTMDELVDVSHALITKYGEGASALACQFYDEIATLEGLLLAPAEPAEVVSKGYVNNAILGAFKNSGENIETIQ